MLGSDSAGSKSNRSNALSIQVEDLGFFQAEVDSFEDEEGEEMLFVEEEEDENVHVDEEIDADENSEDVDNRIVEGNLF